MAEKFQSLLLSNLAKYKRTCSDKDIETVIYIFGKYAKFYPDRLGIFMDDDGVCSTGLYTTLLVVTQHETEPTPFFKILEIDSKIGWVNPEHLERNVFYSKATKIIKRSESKLTRPSRL